MATLPHLRKLLRKLEQVDPTAPLDVAALSKKQPTHVAAKPNPEEGESLSPDCLQLPCLGLMGKSAMM